jgi:hypothetical protein
MIKFSSIFWLLIAVLNSQNSFASSKGKMVLTDSENHFNRGNYKDALDAIKSINIHNDLDNSDEIKLALKIKAIAYFLLGEEKMAVESIHDLYYLDPAYVFDPFDTPPPLVKLANQQKEIIKQKNQELLEIKALNMKKMNKITKETIMVENRPSLMVSLLPFGMNHFYLESPFKGGVYASLQGAGLLANIGAYWWKQSYLLGNGRVSLKRSTIEKNFAVAQYIQWTAFAFLGLSFAISVIDALLSIKNMPEQKIISHETVSFDDG